MVFYQSNHIVSIAVHFSPSKISNNVTLKAETGAEVNVGALGVHIRNEHGDSLVITGEDNEYLAARSMSVETQGPQEYKCTNSDITMRVVEGGDINIENNSTGVASFGDKWSGNVRVKSRNKNVELVGLGDESVVNIITNKAKIQVDNNTGNKFWTSVASNSDGSKLIAFIFFDIFNNSSFSNALSHTAPFKLVIPIPRFLS